MEPPRRKAKVLQSKNSEISQLSVWRPVHQHIVYSEQVSCMHTSDPGSTSPYQTLQKLTISRIKEVNILNSMDADCYVIRNVPNDSVL